jgi:rubrerythrin
MRRENMRIEEKNGELVIVDFNEVDTYRIACKIEEDGIHFYKKLLKRLKSDKVCETLKFLLKEEAEHLKLLEESLFDAEEKREDEYEYGEDDLLTSIDYGIFRPYENINEFEKILDDPKKALKLGVVIEEKSIKFYELCRSEVSDPKAKENLSEIIGEEKMHKKILEEMMLNI